jgi:iron complex outermembrane recepter protein
VVPAAVAQVTPEPTSPALEEITVTARRRAESIQEIPISIEVFSARSLEDRNVFDVVDVAEFTPNMQMSAVRINADPELIICELR